jgi:cytochrome c peroxidase
MTWMRWRVCCGVAAAASVLHGATASAVLSSQEPVVTPQPQRPEIIRFFGPRRLADMKMTVPSDNPITDEKAALGRRLFFDPLMSSDRSVSCATCHDPAAAFSDNQPVSTGVFGRVGRRNSPSLVNRGFGRVQFWDGRAATLEAQVLLPIQDHNEMDMTLDDVVSRLNGDASYRAAFQSVFARPASTDDLGRALATFVRTIRSNDSPYDRFVAGASDALTPEQQLGLRIFRTKGRCTICHIEELFTDEQFQNTGVAWHLDDTTGAGAYVDEGRAAVSHAPQDRGKFKTPSLREVARTAPYMHDGSLATLANVVDFYDRGGRANPNLFPTIRPLSLTAEEKHALVKFLEALSGVVTPK